MEETVPRECRFFVSYTGVKLPLRLVNAVPADGLRNRNTFIRGYFDAKGKLTGFDKVVYGEVELAHRYEYHDNGELSRAVITMPDEDATVMMFDEAGRQTVRSGREQAEP